MSLPERKVVILQSNYVPWRGYFDLIRNADTFIFYDEVKYTKNDWRNRNQVLSQNGTHWITIPVSSESVKIKISDVTLDYKEEWRKSHQSLLQFCYGKAPFYKKQLRPITDHFLFEYQTNNLSDLNQYIIKFISREGQISTEFLDSSEFALKNGKVERLIDLLMQVKATTYISGPAGKDYLSESEHLFKELNMKLEFYQYPKYPILGSGRPEHQYLSILDYLAFEDIKNLNAHLAL